METGRPHDLQQGLDASMNGVEILTSTATPPPVPADYFAQILDTLREGVAVHDRSLRYVVWNVALEELTGLSRAEVLGKLPGEVFPRLHEYGLDACLARALAGETVQLPEQLYSIQPINRELWVVLRFSPWRDSNGEIIGVITTINDTTARRQAVQAQSRQAEKSQAILAKIQEGYYECDLAGNILLCNDALCRMYGYTQAEVIGENYRRLAGRPAIAAQAYRNFKEVYRTGVPQLSQEWEDVNRYGAPVFIEVSVSLMKDERGQAIGFQGIVRDVAARKKLEAERDRITESLRAREARFRALIEESGEGIALLTADLMITYVSPGFTRILGYAARAALDRSALGRVHPDDVSWLLPQLKMLQSQPNATLQVEYRAQHRDGSWRALEAIVTNLLHEPSVAAVVINFRDITARKQDEQTLRQSEQRFRAVFDTARDALLITDDEMRLIDANAAACALLDFVKQDALGRNLAPLVAPGREDAMRVMHQQLLGQSVLEGVYPLNRPGQPPRELELNAVANFLPGRHITVLRDITERRQIEEQLRILGTAVKQAGESILITTANLDHPGPEIVFVNPAFTQNTGYTLKEVLGKTPRLLQGPRTDRATLDRLRAQLARGERFAGETINYRKDGTEFFLEWDVAPVFNQVGEITHYIAVQRDITARKEAEQELLRSERRFRAVFDNAQDAILIFDDEMRILEANAAACELYGYARGELLACRIWDFTTWASATTARAAFQALLRAGQQQRAMPILRADGTRREIEYNATANFLPGRHLMICRDVTARKYAETFVRGQIRVLRLIAAGAPLARTLDVIARLVEKLARGVRCSILLLDEDGQHLRHGAAPRLPEGFNRYVDGLAIGPGMGSCGTAAFKGKPVIVTDIAHDPLWIEDREEALKYGLRACWSTPILATTGRVLGTFALYYREARAPHAAELKLVESLTPLAGIAIERQRSEQALRQSEERYRELFEQAPIGIYRTTPDGRILLANPAMLQLLNFDSLAELAQRNLEQGGWGFRNSRQQFRELIEAQGEVKGSEVVWRRRTGELINVRENAILKRDEHGQVLYYEGTVEDISERKQAEEALRASEARYRSLVAGLDEGVILHDEHGQIIACNASAERILGLRAEQMLRRCTLDPRWRTIYEDGTPFPGAEHPAAVTLRTGRACSNVRMGVRKPDDTLRWLSINAQPLFHAGAAQPYAAVVSFSDITERRQAEEALRASEARFATAFNSSPCPMAMLTFPEGRFVNVNEIWQRDYGFTPDEVIGHTSADFDHWVKPAQRLDLYERLQAHGTVRNLEVLLRTQQGGIRNTIISAEIIEVDGLKYVLTSSNDITERKRAEDALRLSERRYRLLFERNFCGVFRSNLDEHYIECNQAMANIFGYSSPAELLATPVKNLYADTEDRQRLLDRIVSEGQILNSEVRGRRKDGSEVWTVANLTRVTDAGEHQVVFEGVLLDITERKRAEDALRESEARFRTLAETASDAIITIDEASRITFVNPATEKVFGYPLREMLGANLMLLMPAHLGRLHQAGLARYLQIGQRSLTWASLELTGRHRDGQEIPLEISFGEFAHQGRRYFTGIARDITERKRAEEALRESEARFRLLFERNLAGVYRATTSGQLLEANDALARIFGFESRAEILHLDTRRFYADRRTRAQMIKTLRRDGRLNNFELLLRRRDGATVWTLSNITLLPGTDGQPEILEGVMLDITELKQAEMALAQSREELRSLSARLEAVREEERIHIAREIHDNLGQLLTGLKLDFSWLDKRIQEATDETLRKRTAPKMVEVAALLEETIQAVRDIATELRPGILDTLGLRAALEWQAREFEKRTGVKCRMQLGQVPPTLAPERTTMLFRIFQEILTNVARHARARHVQVRLTEAPGELRLLVHDNGVGISAAQRDHPKSLGLIGMRERALLFGGSLIIEGKPGRGTTVEVRVPL